MDLHYEIGDIVRVSQKTCATGIVKIWGKDASPPHPTKAYKPWDYIVKCFDPKTKETYGVSYTLQEKEIMGLWEY